MQHDIPVRNLSGTGMTAATLICSGAICRGSRPASLVSAIGLSEAQADSAKSPASAAIERP
ncbi:hypothetical protein GCM10010836_29770 [Aminobacter aminovorans]